MREFKTTPVDLDELDLLSDAMRFIRSRHNMGRAKREKVRLDLLNRYNKLLKEWAK